MRRLKTIRQTLTLPSIKSEWDGCVKCEIGQHCRNHVFLDWVQPTSIHGVSLENGKLDGVPIRFKEADIVMIGEAPGLAEDLEGIPFCGPAGQLLREVISEANPTCRHCGGRGKVSTGFTALDLTGAWKQCVYCGGFGVARIALVNLLLCRPYEEPEHSGKNREPDYKEVENCMPRLISTLEVLNPSLVVTLGREPASYIPAISHDLEQKGIITKFELLHHPSAILRRGGSMTREGYVARMNGLFEWYFHFHMPEVLGFEVRE